MNETTYLLAAAACLGLAGWCLAQAAKAATPEDASEADTAMQWAVEHPSLAADMNYIDSVFTLQRTTNN